METKREKIRKKAIEIIKSNPNGIRFSQLVKKIHAEFPDISIYTIDGSIWNLDKEMPNEVYKPARGLFRHV
jgi:ribosomal protein S3AE